MPANTKPLIQTPGCRYIMMDDLTPENIAYLRRHLDVAAGSVELVAIGRQVVSKQAPQSQDTTEQTIERERAING